MIPRSGREDPLLGDLGVRLGHARPHSALKSLAKVVGGKLLCQPGGASGDNPDQLKLLYDRTGGILGSVNQRTGEFVEPPASVAGKVGTR